LAAKPVQKITNGFTNRPHPGGKISSTDSEIRSFVYYCQRNLIAIPIFEEKRVILSLAETLGQKLGFDENYDAYSFIALNYSGEISVQISEKDYKKYINELSFDQLCQSLANMFIHFIGLYINGEEEKIIGLLNQEVRTILR